MAKILLVDDEPWNFRALVASLEASGNECVVATDMDGGVAALAASEFSVVVTDIMMPPGKAFRGIDAQETGFHFIEFIQKKYPRLPIVCLSVIADQAKIRLLTQRGVRYLRKGETPLSTAIEVINAVAEGRRVRIKR